ncbi:MAG: transporter [Steroidobacteraceae bacterium]|nr:transporter [Deltaproteobacteria bacterium]
MQRNQKSSFLLASAVLLTSMCAGTTAHASGFGIFTQGASALGQADAVVAHTDEPSAIFFNPALLNKLPGTQIEVGTTLLFPSRDFRSSATGATASTEDSLYYPSTFYFSHAFNDKISAGLGIFNPFGLGTEWNGAWEGRYIATKSKIESYNFNPVASWQITPALSFAAGLDVIYLDATLESKVPLNPNPLGITLPDANQKFKGDGTGLGYNLGVAYNAGHGISLGASYRSEVEIDVQGNLSFDLPSPLLAGALPNTGGKTTITLPRQLLAGVAYQANERLILESGFRWEDWSSNKELKIELDQPVAGQTTAITPKNWHDTFAVNVGGKYRLNDTFSLLGGYLYGWNAVPDDTFEPSVPDSNTHLFTVGTDMKFNQFKLAASYAYQLQEERSKNNDVGFGTANGTYNADIQLLALSLVYKF